MTRDNGRNAGPKADRRRFRIERTESPICTACGLDFFGADQVVFGSDCPFDPEGGPLFIREIIAAIDGLDIPEADRRKIYEDNIRRLAGQRLRD